MNTCCTISVELTTVTQDDLGRVLESDDFQFPGYPIHFASHTTWTNPCLSIPGLGLIGLPLSHRDAELIKASEWTSYNNNIWTINADHIVFENPSWEDAVRSVTSDVQSELGMDSSGKALEYRLDKLLLFGPGSECVDVVFCLLTLFHEYIEINLPPSLYSPALNRHLSAPLVQMEMEQWPICLFHCHPSTKGEK